MSIVSSKEVLDFFKKAKKINNGKNTLPFLDNVLITGGKFVVSNLETTISKPINGVEGDLDDVMVEMAFFQKIVEKIAKQPITVKVDRENLVVSIITSTSKFTLPCELNNDHGNTYPKFIEFTSDMRIGRIPTAAIEKMKALLPFTSTDELRPVMTGFNFDGSYLNATDSHVLANCKFDEMDLSTSFILGRATSSILDNEDYTVYFDGKNVKLENSLGYEYTIRVIEGKYPRVAAVIPTSYSTIIKVNREELINKMKEASICESKASNLQVFTVNIEKKTLTVSSQDIDFNTSYYCNIPLGECEGDNVDIGFKSTFFMKTLTINDSDDVELKFSGVDRACTVDGDMICMPMRLI